jgi:hypothetical protein
VTDRAHASIKRTARLAGGLYLSLIPLGIFSFVYVPSVLGRGDAATTSHNIMASEWPFRSAMFSHLLSQIIVVILALAMYPLLKPVNKDHAVLIVVLALLGPPIAFLNEVHNLAALRLLSHPEKMLGVPVVIAGVAYLFWEDLERGMARYVVIRENGVPTKVVFAGYSFD